MSTLSVRTWVLMSIIPLSVLLQGCDDDCEGGGSGSGSGGLDPCKRDGTTVAEDKECFCSTGAGTGATKMEDNICTNPKVTPAPLASGVTAPPSTAPVGAFCWNSTGECNATAEPKSCLMAFDSRSALFYGNVPADGCFCNGTLLTAGVCKADAANANGALNATALPAPIGMNGTTFKSEIGLALASYASSPAAWALANTTGNFVYSFGIPGACAKAGVATAVATPVSTDGGVTITCADDKIILTQIGTTPIWKMGALTHTHNIALKAFGPAAATDSPAVVMNIAAS